MPIWTPAFIQLATRVFLHPQPTYEWAAIVKGTKVDGRRLVAVDKNTWRAFHREDKSGHGAKDVFIPYFSDNPGRDQIIQQLAEVQSINELDDLSNRMCIQLRHELATGNIKSSQLTPNKYNKIRKPVDIYLEQLVSLATELTPYRERLIPMLRVPLDTWIFGHPSLFTVASLRAAGLRRNSGFGELELEADYLQLQSQLRGLAAQCSVHHNIPFHPIYFDLLWGNRYTRTGGNLFELNP